MYELENKKCSKPPPSIYPITEHVILNMLNLPLTPLYHNYISIYPHKMAMKVHVSCLNLEKKNISSQFSSKKSAVLQALLHGTHGVAEVVHAQLFKARTGQGAAWTFWRKPRSRDPGLGRSIHWIGLFGCLFGKSYPETNRFLP